MSRYGLKLFQDNVNNSFLNDLEYMLKINPKNAEEHFDTCLLLSYNKYRHYPNYWACRKGYSMVCKALVWCN